MKTLLCLFIALVSLSVTNAQSNNRTTDSLKYYEKQLRKVSREYHDSMRRDPRFDDAVKSIDRIRKNSDNYTAFALYTTISSADFKKINSDNALSNFGPLSGPMIGVGYGFSFKKNRRMFDLNVSTFGIQKKIKKGNETIRTSITTVFQLEWGYDFIKSNTINIYPYVGFGFRGSSLSYTAPNQTNNAFTNISNIIQNDPSASSWTNELGYQAGIGFEFVTSKSPSRGGTIIYVKAGTNGAFVKSI